VNFSFSEVEEALAVTYDIDESKRLAFRARLQHLQKLKFPAGLNTGRGRAATYTVGHIYLLAVALELLQLGLSPDRAKRVIEEDLHSVAMAGSMVARSGAPESRRFTAPMFLYCDPAALRELTKIYQDEDWASQTFFYGGMGAVTESFKEWFIEGVQRMAFFSVSALVFDLARCMLPKTKSMAVFYEGLAEWADPFIHNVNYPLDRHDQPYWYTIEMKIGDT
tara:strand:+ start:8605 stop:9270 length:666 start_codon:yes stop_codon:yes gene_type:complete